MSPIQKIIDIALQEVGYLEKRNNSNLYDKTANAGSNNYTKYWADLYPDLQAQPWCAIFVTWVFVQAFGKEKTKQLLKHYPYTYCPTMSNLFTLHANPQPGDIVIFWRNGEFAHTGIVTGVSGDYFTTVEGNTSNGSAIIPNGGSVCKKGYYNSNLPGTKFCRPDWTLAEDKPPIFSETPVNNLTGIINATSLNVRKYPSTDSDILAAHTMGDQVTISAQTDNGWYRVDYPFGAGYIFGQYVSVYQTASPSISQEDFNAMVQQNLVECANMEPGAWSQEARNFCEAQGIFNGDDKTQNMRYCSFVTREELVQLLYNYYKRVTSND